MLLTPVQLQREHVPLDESLAPGAIDFGPDVTQTAPLSIQGRADLLEEHRGHGETVDDIRLRMTLRGAFDLQCARCLSPVPQSLDATFDLIFRPAGIDVEAGEHAITEDETEIGYYEKSGLLLEDAVREQVLLALPGRVLCTDDCQGLPHRHSFPSELEEAHTEAAADPRWKALAGLDLKPNA